MEDYETHKLPEENREYNLWHKSIFGGSVSLSKGNKSKNKQMETNQTRKAFAQ